MATRHFYYTDQWQVVEERVDASTSPERQFVWGTLGPDNLVLRDRPGSSERLYALSDYASVTAIVDASGTVVERYSYNAFGAINVMDASWGSISASAYDWETMFGSYRWDSETGFYQVRNRYHHAQLGRWLSRDPIGYEAGINLYAYCGNSTWNKFDPMGLLTPIEAIAAAVVIVASVDIMLTYAANVEGVGAVTITGTPITHYSDEYEKSPPLVQESVRIHEEVHQKQPLLGHGMTKNEVEQPAYLAQIGFINSRIEANDVPIGPKEEGWEDKTKRELEIARVNAIAAYHKVYDGKLSEKELLKLRNEKRSKPYKHDDSKLDLYDYTPIS